MSQVEFYDEYEILNFQLTSDYMVVAYDQFEDKVIFLPADAIALVECRTIRHVDGDDYRKSRRNENTYNEMMPVLFDGGSFVIAKELVNYLDMCRKADEFDFKVPDSQLEAMRQRIARDAKS